MNALDTNVSIYSHDVRDQRKQQRAQELIANLEPMALLWQVGCEFVAASSKLEPFGFTPDQAWDALVDMQAMADAVLLPDREMWALARDLQERHSLHFWDALIAAGCIRGGVETLYSEDLAEGSDIDGLAIVNPFSRS